jgi:polysaccharide pyruvyl transferase WcaK-like protein
MQYRVEKYPVSWMEQIEERVALLHHTGCGNLGDDAILDVVVRNIRKRWKNAEITILSMNPQDTAERHGVRCFPLRRFQWKFGTNVAAPQSQAKGSRLASWFARTRTALMKIPRAMWGEAAFLLNSLRLLRSFDVMVVSGGGQLTERGGPWSFPYALYVWTLLARWAGVRTIFLNVGAGPLNHPLSKFFIPSALRRADYVSFRDEQSQRLLADLGFRGPSHVLPDNVYGLEVIPRQAQAGTSDAPIVGINPMLFPFSDLLRYPANANSIQDELIDRMATFVSLLVGDSYSIQFFGSDIRSDPAEIEHLRTVLRDRHHIALQEYASINSVDELLIRISGMDYVVTCRFHGVVFAHLLNKPVLAIAHHPKVTHLMSALGLSDYCVDMLTFSPHRLTETFMSLVANKKVVKERMAAKAAEFRAKSSAQFDEIFAGTTSAFELAAGAESRLPANTPAG